MNFFDRNNFLSSEINLCGNNGDPIYHPRFLEILKQLKNQNHKIKIATNGSAKTEKFWTQVGDITDKQDTITFGIDGLDDTNHLYRIGSNFDKIIENATAYINAGGKAEWQFIEFAHNYHQIDDAEKLASKLGFTNFTVKYTARFQNTFIIIIFFFFKRWFCKH